MIEEFSFGNFKSFKEMQSLNMTAAKITSKNKDIDKTNIIPVNDKLSLLKAKAIYGANASGKSNVVKALTHFISIVKDSVKNDELLLQTIDSFQLSTETEDEPVFFQLIFIVDGIKYRYGFEANDFQIASEWLYATPNQRETPFFIREGDKIIELNTSQFTDGKKLKSLYKGNVGEIARHNSLFLTSITTFGFGKISRQIVEYLSSITFINGLGQEGMFNNAIKSMQDHRMEKFTSSFLKKADTGMHKIAIIRYANKPEEEVLMSVKKSYNNNQEVYRGVYLDFQSQESEGTKKMFELSPYIYDALKNGKPIIIDEFDARFHPLLTKKIVELFNSEESKAQLIFTTHDTNLLSSDLLRRDQIEFVEKDKYGASHLYTLVQFKGVRNTASFEKDYIQGKYGAIPFLGNFNDILNIEDDAQENESN